MRYGEKEIKEFNIDDEAHLWPNNYTQNYTITIELPEFMCRCPRSGYPDFAKITLVYVPDKWIIELKALKLYINTFIDRYISHEDAANEIYTTLYNKLRPKSMELTADFNPRGNVHTLITIYSEDR